MRAIAAIHRPNDVVVVRAWRVEGGRAKSVLGEEACKESCEETTKSLFIIISSISLAAFLFPGLYWYITPLVMWRVKLEEEGNDSTESLKKRKQTVRALEHKQIANMKSKMEPKVEEKPPE